MLQPGPLEGIDTFVRSDGYYLNDNLGTDRSMFVGDRARQRGDFRALLRFELARLPPGAEVLRAKLELFRVGGTAPGELEILCFEVLPTPGRTPWVEGSSGRDEFLDGVCWEGAHPRAPYPAANSRMPGYSQPSYAAQPFARRAPRPLPRGAWLQIELSALVRGWLARPERNLGIMIRHGREGPPFDQGFWAFASSDFPEAAKRPRLTIRYRGGPPLAGSLEARARAGRAQAERALAELRASPSMPAEQVLRRIQEALRASPHEGELYLERARLAYRLGFRHGLNDTGLALEVQRPAGEYGVRLIRARFLLTHYKQVERALKESRLARAARPSADAFSLEYRSLQALGRGAEAQRVLEEGLARHPTSPLLRALRSPSSR